MESSKIYAVPRRIAGFPYPDRYCPHCERQLVIENTCHVLDNPEHFKVIFQCHNLKCSYLNKYPYRGYVRAYYSSEHAEHQLYSMLLQYKKVEKPSAE